MENLSSTKANTDAARKRSGLNSGLDAIEAIAAHGRPMTMTEIAAAIGLTKASIHKTLATLEARQFVRRLEDQRYVIGIKAWEIGCIAAPLEITRVATPYMTQLVREVEDGVSLAILSGSDMLCVQLIESPQAVRVHGDIGERTPIHTLSTGLAYLSALDDDEVLRILPPDLERRTALTVTDRHRVLDMVRETRRRGYAVCHGMCMADASGIAAVVRGPDGRPAAALCIALPSFRATAERVAALASPLLATAREIERECGAPEQETFARTG
jgi:DNA-binding IclR family transcriptional regulator